MAGGGAPRRPRPARAWGNPLYSLGRASTLARRRPPKLAGMDAGPSGDDRGQGTWGRRDMLPACLVGCGVGGSLAAAVLSEGKAAAAGIMELTPATSITALWSLARFRCRCVGRQASNQVAEPVFRGTIRPTICASAVRSHEEWARTDHFSPAPRQIETRDRVAVTGPVLLGAGLARARPTRNEASYPSSNLPELAQTALCLPMNPAAPVPAGNRKSSGP
jgi:hypothetical protein